MKKEFYLPQNFVFKSKYASGLFIVHSGRLRVYNDRPIENIYIIQYIDIFNTYGALSSYFEITPKEMKKKFKTGEFYSIAKEEWPNVKKYLTERFSSSEKPREFVRCIDDLVKNQKI